MESNPVQTEVKRQLERQIAKGEAKYGHGIILGDGHDWLQEAIEEAIDGLQYLCALKLETPMLTTDELKLISVACKYMAGLLSNTDDDYVTYCDVIKKIESVTNDDRM